MGSNTWFQNTSVGKYDVRAYNSKRKKLFRFKFLISSDLKENVMITLSGIPCAFDSSF